MTDTLEIRKGSPSVELTRDEFRERFRARFVDPLFEPLTREIERLEEVAWSSYRAHHKAPRTRKAGAGFADPSYDLSLDWLAARDALTRASHLHASSEVPRVLVIAGGARNEHTCPGEQSKTQRLVGEACDELRRGGAHVDLHDLSETTAEYGRVIYPCKGCVSTAMPLCHWPCSCYPFLGLGLVVVWLAVFYPRWVAAHGIAIVTPVYWYQAPSPLKLMIDRLVCADGGNPDPSTTHGKDAAQAKALELAGWSYPRHLAERAFANAATSATSPRSGSLLPVTSRFVSRVKFARRRASSSAFASTIWLWDRSICSSWPASGLWVSSSTTSRI